MSERVEIELVVDTTIMREELEEVLDTKEDVEREVNSSVVAMVGQMRAAVQMTFQFLEASGIAIDQTLFLWAESLLLAAEGAAIMAVAGSITGVGLLKMGAALALLLQVRAINQRRTENAQRTGQLAAGLRGLAYVF